MTTRKITPYTPKAINSIEIWWSV